MADTTSASDALIVSPDRVRSIFRGVLRAAQSAGWTDAALEAASGVPARTIKGYRIDGKEPPLSSALSIACVVGMPALNPILGLIGYVARPLDEADELNPMAIAAGAMAALSVIANAAADGRIDHLERPGCRDAADTIIATVLPLSTAGGAA